MLRDGALVVAQRACNICTYGEYSSVLFVFFFCCFLCSLHLAVYAASCRSTFIRSRLSCAFLWSSSSSWLLRRVFSSVFSCSTAFLFLRLLRLAADDQLLALIVHALIFCVRWDFLFSSAEVGYGLPFNKKLATKKKKELSGGLQERCEAQHQRNIHRHQFQTKSGHP